MRTSRIGLAMALAAVCVAGAATARAAGGVPEIRSVRHGSAAAPGGHASGVAQVRSTAPAVASVRGAAGGGLTIVPTFGTSITTHPDAAAIEAAVNAAIASCEAVFSDPIVVNILFRYATTYADGSPLPPANIGNSETGLYRLDWNAFLPALTADAKTANDATANATLPGTALAAKIDTASANGRAVGLDTPSIKFADGSLGLGGPYDGIITLNSDLPISFTRPPASGTFDAQRTLEHEIDEVLGLGSAIEQLLPDLRPQDLFSWAAPGVRGLTSSGSRYFSIDGGTTDLVGFNQDPDGDSGDWLSGPCPQDHPYVQNAFSCTDQFSDVSPTSPEGINLDVVGYDLATSASSSTTTTTLPLPCPPPQIECCPVGQPGCGLCGTDCHNGGCCPANLPVCDNANQLCISCSAGQVECCPVGQPGCGLCGTDCQNGACCPPSAPICDNTNGLCLVSLCPGDQVLCDDSALGFPDVTCCSVPANKRQCTAACSSIVAACKASCAGVQKVKKCKKRCRAAIVGGCRRGRPPACG